MNIERITDVIRAHYDDYADCGNTYHGEPIIVADWNKVPDKLESYCYTNFETGYHDDTIMDDNGIYHRTDDPTYVIWDCSACAIDFFVNDSNVLIEYIKSELTDNPSSALGIPSLVDVLPKIAAKVSDGHENGFYAGMNDNPMSIMKGHKDYGRDNLFFALSAQTPFMVEFELWQLNDEDDDQ